MMRARKSSDLTLLRAIGCTTLVTVSGCASLNQPPALMFERAAVAVRFSVPARDIAAIELRGGVADIEIEGTTDSLIRAELSLRSTDTLRLRRECVESARLDTSRARGTFVVSLRQETRNRCGETWHVHVPSRLAAAAHVNVGMITLDHVRGGVTARVRNQGGVSGTVGGDVDVQVDVGDIDLTAEGSQYGQVELSSAVGKVDLTLGGYSVAAEGRRGSGERVRASGAGKSSFSAVTRVGKVKARVGTAALRD